MLYDTTEMIHNFEIYAGKILPAVSFPDLGASANIVFRLVCVVKPDFNHIVCFDDWFTSLTLVVELAKCSIFTLGTIRSNRAPGCSFSNDVDMRKRERRAFEEKGTSLDGVHVRIVKWYDNRAVQFASSRCGEQPLSSVEQWDRSKKQRVSINCPAIVDMYNNSTGDVDAIDALISYYCIHIKSKKYYLRIFFIW